MTRGRMDGPRRAGHAGRVAALALGWVALGCAGPGPAPLTVLPAGSTGWHEHPCAMDSADTWGWTRFDLREIRLRVPPGTRHVKVPNVDELHFQLGRSRLRLRLHNDAFQVFASVYRPEQTYRFCVGEIAGRPAEAISFGPRGRNFAARWPDVVNGEWLAAVVTGYDLAQTTVLRQALFTIEFPGEPHR